MQAFFEPFNGLDIRDGVLAQVLSELNLWGEREDEPGDTVLLSTYHSAKGLEFERVICMGVNAGTFPFYSAKDPAEIAEARRLLYVGMTRAKRRLVITIPMRYNGYRKDPEPIPSINKLRASLR